MYPPNSQYDSELQMFMEQPRDANLAHLRFLRWLGERGRLEHPLAGPPAGLFALRPAANTGYTACPIGQPEHPPARPQARDARGAML